MPKDSEAIDRKALRQKMLEHQRAARTCRSKGRDFKDPERSAAFYREADKHSRIAMNIMLRLNRA